MTLTLTQGCCVESSAFVKDCEQEGADGFVPAPSRLQGPCAKQGACDPPGRFLANRG